MTSTNFQQLVDITFGGHENGQINFNSLHSLLYSLVFKMGLFDVKALVDQDALKKISDQSRDFQLVKTLKDNMGMTSFVGLADRINSIEGFWKELNELPKNQELIEKVRATPDTISPLTDIWDKLTTSGVIETNQIGITKVLTLLEDIIRELVKIEKFNREIADAIAAPELQETMIDENGVEIPSEPMDLKTAIQKIGEAQRTFDEMREQMDDIMARMGEGHVPPDEFFDNLPSWSLIENLLKGEYDDSLTGDAKRRLGEIPPSLELKTWLADLGGMISYNDQLLGRITTLEQELQKLADRSATKADIQKLNIKMAEVQGIASAVDRLLCRIQGSEDQLCCIRQVVNKIYGCVANSAGANKNGGTMLACLGTNEAALSGHEDGNNAKGGRKKSTNSGDKDGGLNEEQLKIFMDQLTKLQCELDAIKRSLVNVDSIKADVQNLFSIVNELDENKLDKCLLLTELAQKADKDALEDKVNQACFEETCQGLNSVINEVLNKILDNDRDFRNIFSHLEKTVKTKCDREELEYIKEQIEMKLKCFAKNFIGLQKNFAENNASSDDIMQNLVGTGNARSSGMKNSGNTSGVPLAPGLAGNKMLKQFPLSVRGVEIKANNYQTCNTRQANNNVRNESKNSGKDENKPFFDESCFGVLNISNNMDLHADQAAPHGNTDLGDFVLNTQNNMQKTLDNMKGCDSKKLGDNNCKHPMIDKSKLKNKGLPENKNETTGLIIPDASKNPMTDEFKE